MAVCVCLTRCDRAKENTPRRSCQSSFQRRIVIEKNSTAFLDFWSGSHGHFLEYLINCWIFGCPRTGNLFTDTGACHGARHSNLYSKHAVVLCGHYSENKILPTALPEKVIRITIDDFFSRCCYQINAWHRTGDVSIRQREINSIEHGVRDDPALLRAIYYSKIQDPKLGHPMPDRWLFDQMPIMHIPMRSMYNFSELLHELKATADFLQRNFVPDNELLDTWQEFMHRNQGWHSWVMCDVIMTKIISRIDHPIKLALEQQALLNVMLTATFDVHDGELFDTKEYPDNTAKVIEILEKQKGGFFL